METDLEGTFEYPDLNDEAFGALNDVRQERSKDNIEVGQSQSSVKLGERVVVYRVFTTRQETIGHEIMDVPSSVLVLGALAISHYRSDGRQTFSRYRHVEKGPGLERLIWLDLATNFGYILPENLRFDYLGSSGLVSRQQP